MNWSNWLEASKSAAVLTLLAMFGAGCAVPAQHHPLRRDELRFPASRMPAASNTLAGVRIEAVFEREAPEIMAKLGLGTAVGHLGRTASSSVLVHFDSGAVTNNLELAGRKLVVTGFLDEEASRRAGMPVVQGVLVKNPDFVPPDFAVPMIVRTDRFEVRPLVARDVVPDYDAVMSSRERLSTVFEPESNWPRADMTLAENLQDLAWHQDEWERRSSFSYSVFTLDGSTEIGCIYFFPSKKKGIDAKAILWMRDSHASMDKEVLEFTRAWLKKSWPFEKVVFPGREISWTEWKKLP